MIVAFSVGLAAPAAAAPPALPCVADAAGTTVTCTYDVAPGDYTVIAGLADGTAVQAEARRVFGVGEARRPRVLTVNVREPEAQPTGDGGPGTPGLQLRFSGADPMPRRLVVHPARYVPHLYLAGDSTVCDQPTAPYTGWGQLLPASVRPGISVANFADSGEGTASFLAKPELYPALVGQLRRGEHVLIQFGHNDKTTTAEEFRANLTTAVDGIRAVGGVPVLVTPTARRRFTPAGTLDNVALHFNSLGVDLPTEMKAVATEKAVPLIDLTTRSKELIESLGVEGSKILFLSREVDGRVDNTHFSVTGAARMAELVVAEAGKLGLPIARHFT